MAPWGRARQSVVAAALVALAPLAGCKQPPLGSEGKPIYAVGRPAEKSALEANGYATCALRKDGKYCWGADLQYTTPTRFPRHTGPIALGSSHYCVLNADGSVACIGRNVSGEIGDGTRELRSSLTPVLHLSEVTQIAAGSFKSCAIASSGDRRDQVFCWGAEEGRLGLSSTSPTRRRIGTIEDARELAIGEGLSCVRRGNGTVWCWGTDTQGELGRGDEGMPWTNQQRPPASEPVRVLHVDDAVGIGAGAFFGCVLTSRGTVGCWGNNRFGALGDGTTRSRSYASEVRGLADVAQIAVGSLGHACARERDGSVWCWGYDIGRAIEGGERLTPQRVEGLTDAVDLAAGHAHVCARRKNGAVVCWGHNDQSQLARAPRVTSAHPVEVLGPE